MGDVIDLEAWRRRRREAEPERPRRRLTPGGRGFDEDITRQLPPGTPPSKDDPKDDRDG